MRRPALKNGAAALIIALIAAAAAFFLLPRDDERGGSLRIGCGDDISGIHGEADDFGVRFEGKAGGVPENLGKGNIREEAPYQGFGSSLELV